MLQTAGARRVTLRTSFRARPNIQRTINAAFEPVMTGDPDSLQAAYVPLEPFRSDSQEQPSVVVLPVPEPYGYRRLSNLAIENSLPDAVGAFIEWLINESGWKVAERPADRSSSRNKIPSIPLFQRGKYESPVMRLWRRPRRGASGPARRSISYRSRRAISACCSAASSASGRT